MSDLDIPSFADLLALGGLPAYVPCTVDGESALCHGAIRTDDMSDYEHHPSDLVRAVVALDACRRVYAEAQAFGANVLIR